MNLRIAENLALPLDIIAVKLCECGCGRPTAISKWNDNREGYKAGEAKRFIHGHRKSLTYEEKLKKQRERSRKWRARNRDKLLEYFRTYREKNKEHLAKAKNEYYHQHIENWKKYAKDPETKQKRRLYNKTEQRKKSVRAWRERNPERVREADRRRRERTREQKRERDRIWRIRNPEKYRSSILKAKALKPDLYCMIQRHSRAVRRARQKSIFIEPVSFKRILDRDGMQRHLCLGLVSPSDVSLDHLIPVARGGAFAEWNLMTSHLSCNQRRGTKPVLSQETCESAEAYLEQRLDLFMGRMDEKSQNL